jgi:5'-methylthioadenosine phosphorylase
VAFPTLLQPQDVADVGVFGGSGLYTLLDGPTERYSLHTPYGPPSGDLTVGRIADVRVAFLPRHGPRHQLPPHAINYRANVWAMAQLGVTRLLAPNAAGSLQPNITPGQFVICDQFVDRTYGRAQTYYDGPHVVHISTADPYCPELRTLTIAAARAEGIEVHEQGTVVVIQGPRFSTRAESRWYARQGWEVINMTQFPEVVLARELGMCYVNISLITDFDAGLEGQPGIRPVTVTDVQRVLTDNNARGRQLIARLVPTLPPARTCGCARALDLAVIS